jgi:hypothetical protein
VSLETVANTIRTRWYTNIESGESIPTVYDNAPADDQSDSSTWARVRILWGETLMPALGQQKTFRTVGRLLAQLYVPVENGDKAALELADSIRADFRAVTDTGVTFKSPSVSAVGREDNWWRVDVSCPFYTDELV